MDKTLIQYPLIPWLPKTLGFEGMPPFLVIKSRLCYCSSTNLFQKCATFFGIHGMILWLLIGQYTP
jgi:hypothetical protein